LDSRACDSARAMARITNKKSSFTNPENLRIGKLKCKIPLIQLRVFLFLANLIVLASAVAAFSAARDARSSAENYIDLVGSFKPDEVDQEWMSGIGKHVEQILHITSLNLLLYWLIYGVAISLHFFGTYSLCVLLVSVPHTLVMVLWELGLAAFFLKMSWVSGQLGQVDGHPMEDFYTTWTPTLVALLLPTCVVQLFTASLSFFIFNSQRDYNNNLENGERCEVWHTNTQILTKHASTPRTNNPDYVDFNPEVLSLYHTEMPEQILKKNRPGTIARIRKTSERVMDTMSKVYNNECSAWRLTQQNETSDQVDGVLPGRYKSYTSDDYMDMSSESSSPPSYKSNDGFLV